MSPNVSSFFAPTKVLLEWRFLGEDSSILRQSLVNTVLLFYQTFPRPQLLNRTVNTNPYTPNCKLISYSLHTPHTHTYTCLSVHLPITTYTHIHAPRIGSNKVLFQWQKWTLKRAINFNGVIRWNCGIKNLAQKCWELFNDFFRPLIGV